MSKHFGVLGFSLSLLASVTAPLAAQVTTGSILVRSVDEQSAVMPGVPVTVSSPVLVAGQVTGTTDANGAHYDETIGTGTPAGLSPNGSLNRPVSPRPGQT